MMFGLDCLFAWLPSGLGYMEPLVMFTLHWCVLSGRQRLTVGHKNMREKATWVGGGERCGEVCCVRGTGWMCQSWRVGCITTLNNPRSFSCIKNKEVCHTSQIRCLFTLHPISKKKFDLRPFRLSGGKQSDSFTV